MTHILQSPVICLISKGELTGSNFYSELPKLLELFREAANDGVNLIQIREKNLPGGLLSELALRTVEAVAGSSTRVVVNDRVDVAMTAGGSAVHLGQHSMPPAVVRRVFGTDILIGVSTHSLEEAKSAAAGGADYIIYGPVFNTPGKGPAVGVDSLDEVCRAVAPLPVIALGGIDAENLHLLERSEIVGIAAIRALHDRDTRRRICRKLTSTGKVS